MKIFFSEIIITLLGLPQALVLGRGWRRFSEDVLFSFLSSFFLGFFGMFSVNVNYFNFSGFPREQAGFAEAGGAGGGTAGSPAEGRPGRWNAAPTAS